MLIGYPNLQLGFANYVDFLVFRSASPQVRIASARPDSVLTCDRSVEDVKLRSALPASSNRGFKLPRRRSASDEQGDSSLPQQIASHPTPMPFVGSNLRKI